MFNIYLAQAWRNICRNKLQSILSMVGLAVALFCFTFFAHLVCGSLIEDAELVDADRIVKLKTDDGSYIDFTPELLSLLDEVDEVESYCRCCFIARDWDYCSTAVKDADYYDAQTEVSIYAMDTTMMEFLSLKVLAGSWQDAVKSENSILLIQETAVAMYGSVENAIGQSLYHFMCPGAVVRAVVEKLPYGCSMNITPSKGGFVLNLTEIESTRRNGEIWVKCSKEYTKEQLAKRIEQAHITYLNGNHTLQVVVHDYRAWNWDKLWKFLLALLVVTLPGSLILLAALSNFFHLLVSDVLARQREYVLRRVHGAHTRDLWYMVSTYVTLMLVLVGFFSLLIIEVFFPFFDLSERGNMVYMSMSAMMRQNAYALFVLVLIGLLIAWLAVIRVRKGSMQESIKSSSGRRPGRHIWRNILLGYQLTLALLFLILLGAVLMQEQVNYDSVAPQFTAQEKKDLLVLRPKSNLPYYNEFNDARLFDYHYGRLLNDCTDIQEYHFVHNELGKIYTPQGWCLRENDDLDTIKTRCAELSTADLQFMHYEVNEGRLAETPDEVVVDKEFLRTFGLKIGDKIRRQKHRLLDTPRDIEDPERLTPLEYYIIANLDYREYVYTITGCFDEGPVVNMRSNMQQYNYLPKGCVYFNDSYAKQELWIRCYPGKGREVARRLNEQFQKNAEPTEVKAFGSDYRYKKLTYEKVLSLSDIISEKQDSSLDSLVGYFWFLAAIAVALTLFGIYSAVSVDTKFRRKEMAIRKINGAKTWQIAFLFLRLYIVEIIVAAILAITIGNILIENIWVQAYRVCFSHGVLFYLSVVLILAFFVAITIGMQVWRIARVQPASIIKSE